MAQDWSLERLYHTVVNVKNLDDSVAFYRLLGFDVLDDRRDVDLAGFRRDDLRHEAGKGPRRADDPAEPIPAAR